MGDTPSDHNDPRHKNILPHSRSLSGYVESYTESIKSALVHLDISQLEEAVQTIVEATKRGRRILVAGNGGSAAIADHLCCDFTKGTQHHDHKTLSVHSLVGSTALLTALANDFSYERIFEKQVEYTGQTGDVLILISSSGNSPNIIHALRAAKAKEIAVIGLTGFEGGRLKEEADISIHIPIKNYGMAEDCHQMIMHIIAQYIARSRDEAINE